MSAKGPRIVKEKEEKVQESDVLLLYHNEGEVGILQRLASKIGESLSNKDSKFCEWFGEEFELGTEEIEGLKAGKEPVAFHFFEKVQEALGISLDDVLGEPSFNGQEGYWRRQLKIKPMVLAAPTGEKEWNKLKKIDKDIELRFYVRLRAISRLLGNK